MSKQQQEVALLNALRHSPGLGESVVVLILVNLILIYFLRDEEKVMQETSICCVCCLFFESGGPSRPQLTNMWEPQRRLVSCKTSVAGYREEPKVSDFRRKRSQSLFQHHSPWSLHVLAVSHWYHLGGSAGFVESSQCSACGIRLHGGTSLWSAAWVSGAWG